MDPIIKRYWEIQAQLVASKYGVGIRGSQPEFLVAAATLVLAETVAGLMTDGIPVSIQEQWEKMREWQRD
jgi:hypothetical protein